MPNKKGFTLIELLIVVAIIAILAAIAIPNFLAAQVRAKVARVRGEHRSLATALESYYVDNNEYPIPAIPGYLSETITTPIAYIANDKFLDPFRVPDVTDPLFMRYRYMSLDVNGTYSGVPAAINAYSDVYGKWRLSSSGPDNIYGPASYFTYQGYSYNFLFPYDPSNGTVSQGDIMRSQKNAQEESKQP